MKVKLTIYKVEKVIDIPDRDLEGMNKKEREQYIEDWMFDDAKLLLDYEWREYEGW